MQSLKINDWNHITLLNLCHLAIFACIFVVDKLHDDKLSESPLCVNFILKRSTEFFDCNILSIFNVKGSAEKQNEKMHQSTENTQIITQLRNTATSLHVSNIWDFLSEKFHISAL